MLSLSPAPDSTISMSATSTEYGDPLGSSPSGPRRARSRCISSTSRRPNIRLGDALLCGLADHFVPTARLGKFLDAQKSAELITTHSPTALKTTLLALRRARTLSTLEEVLDQESRVSCALLGMPELPEGIRAQVVDKDRAPC
ncbi:enoyl-CoA hydratase/isomerase family protein [Streptomyces sp. NPDC087843]|uniref:enoyl-CoA hydratase/isomerase family protein n=1 Tax=Streptomyces sp. NPDC087843 TaxID=3365804 RepID=UPI003829EAFA